MPWPCAALGLGTTTDRRRAGRQPLAHEVACELIPPGALLAGVDRPVADRVVHVRRRVLDGALGLLADRTLPAHGQLAFGREAGSGALAVAAQPVVDVPALVAQPRLHLVEPLELVLALRAEPAVHVGLLRQPGSLRTAAPAELASLIFQGPGACQRVADALVGVRARLFDAA